MQHGKFISVISILIRGCQGLCPEWPRGAQGNPPPPTFAPGLPMVLTSADFIAAFIGNNYLNVNNVNNKEKENSKEVSKEVSKDIYDGESIMSIAVKKILFFLKKFFFFRPHLTSTFLPWVK
jgi:hypothetical protein